MKTRSLSYYFLMDMWQLAIVPLIVLFVLIFLFFSDPLLFLLAAVWTARYTKKSLAPRKGFSFIYLS